MAVAFVSGDHRLTSPGTSITFSFTAGSGSDRLLLAYGRDVGFGSISVSSMTYAGASMSSVSGPSVGQAYQKTAAATGANNITFNLSAYGRLFSSVSDWTGVDQTTPIGTVVNSSGSSSAPSVTVSTGDAVLAAETNIYTGSGSFSATVGTLIGGVRDPGSGRGSASGYRTSTGAVTFSIPGSASWDAVGFPISAAGGAAATSFAMPRRFPRPILNF